MAQTQVLYPGEAEQGAVCTLVPALLCEALLWAWPFCTLGVSSRTSSAAPACDLPDGFPRVQTEEPAPAGVPTGRLSMPRDSAGALGLWSPLGLPLGSQTRPPPGVPPSRRLRLLRGPVHTHSGRCVVWGHSGCVSLGPDDLGVLTALPHPQRQSLTVAQGRHR